MKFSRVFTIDRSDVHAKGQGERSRSHKPKQILPQFGCFLIITPVSIHRWLWNHAQSFKWCSKGAFLFSRSSIKFQSHTVQKIDNLDLNWAFPDFKCNFNLWMATEWCTKLKLVQKRCLIPCLRSYIKFQSHTRQKSMKLTQIECFLAVTPVWNYRLPPNNAKKLEWCRWSALLFVKDINQIQRSHRPKNWFGSRLSDQHYKAVCSYQILQIYLVLIAFLAAIKQL